jgi:hypothetical protein
MFMRQLMKFLHTVSSAGIVGGLVAYGLILSFAPQATPQDYADMRQTISAICQYMIMPALGISLVTGLLAMAVHRPFQELRWVWVKALLGISMFEATLAIIQAKGADAARISAKIAAGEPLQRDLALTISSEWTTLGAIMAISLANYVLGVWRPSLAMRWVVR